MEWTQPIFYRGTALSVEVNQARGFTEKQLNRLSVVIEKMLIVLNSLEFKIVVTSERDLGERGYTPVGLYERIMSGGDRYGSEDCDIDIDITLFNKRWSKVVGYTYPGTMRTWFNRKFWRNDAFVAGNIIHEYCHNAGFGETVAYLYGDTMNRMVGQLDNGKEFHQVKEDILFMKELTMS